MTATLPSAQSPSLSPMPLETYNTDTLRRLISRSRAILRDRGCIPEASLRKADTPTLTDEDRRTISRAARRFDCSPLALAEEVLALRAQPQVVTIAPREGPAVCVTPLLRVAWNQRSGVVVTGTGHVVGDLLLPYRWSRPDAAVGEYVVVQPTEQSSGAEPESRARQRWDFTRVYGAGFVRACQQLQDRPTAAALRIILAQAAHDDTPQEALLTWCLRAVAHRLQAMADNGALLDQLLARPLSTFTLADLLRPALRDVRLGTEPLRLVPTPGSHDWYHRVLRAVELFLVGTNLLAPDLETDPVIEVPLVQLWQWYTTQERFASVRAHHLRAAVVQRFGFQEIQWHECRAWVKTVPRLAPDLERYQIPERLKIQPHVLVTETCRVYVNGQYRCVVEGRSADLPQADQVVRRLLAVATAHRTRIHTLTTDLAVLEQLFADVTEQRLWPLLRDVQASLPTIH